MAVGGIYDLRQHLDDVVMPVLCCANGESSSARTSAQKVRDDLAAFIKDMNEEAARFEESKARYLEREARKADRVRT